MVFLEWDKKKLSENFVNLSLRKLYNTEQATKYSRWVPMTSLRPLLRSKNQYSQLGKGDGNLSYVYLHLILKNL